MRGYRDGKPVVNCDVCHKPITDRKGKRIEKPRDAYRANHPIEPVVLDVHNTSACKKKVGAVKISKPAPPEEPEEA